jgi:hypothetical protein
MSNTGNAMGHIKGDAQASEEIETYNPSQMFEGIYLPNWLLFADISINAALVYAYLSKAAGPNGKCFPGQDTIASALNRSVRTVERAISELKKAGFLKASRRNYAGSTNAYEFILHPFIQKELEIKSNKRRGGSSSDNNVGSASGRSTSDNTVGCTSDNTVGCNSANSGGSHIKKKVLKRNKQKIIKRETNLIKSVVRGSETEESNGTKVYPNTASIATEIWSQGLGDRLDPYLGEDENVLFWDLCSMLSGKKSAKTPSEEEQVNAFLHVAHISVHHMFEYDLVGGAVNQTFLEKRYLDKKNKNTLLFADIALTMFKVYTGLNVDVLNVRSWESYLYNKKIKLHAGDVKSWPDFCQYVAYEINAPENTFYEDIVAKGEISFKQLSRLHKRFRDDT